MVVAKQVRYGFFHPWSNVAEEYSVRFYLVVGTYDLELADDLALSQVVKCDLDSAICGVGR